MKIFIKYKQDVYKRNLKFLDTDLMYYFNGNSYEKLRNWLVIINCIKENYPIVVLSDYVESMSDGELATKIEFVINPSSVAMVFPVDSLLEQCGVDSETVTVDQYLNEEKKIEKAEKDFWLCKDCGAQLPDCTCPPSSKYIGSTNVDGITS